MNASNDVSTALRGVFQATLRSRAICPSSHRGMDVDADTGMTIIDKFA